MLIKILFFIIGVLVVFALAFAWSNDRFKIRYRYLFQILAIQLVLAYALLRSEVGVWLIKEVTVGFEYLLQYAQAGTGFVFGDLSNADKFGFIFFFAVGMPIVLMSAIIGILQFFKILPFIIRWIGTGLSKVNGLGKLESFNAISSLTIGQSENPIVYKNVFDKLPNNVIYTMAATMMSTVSLAVVGAYMTIVDPKYVCVALVMNMFSVFFVLHVINPYEPDRSLSFDKLNIDLKQDRKPSFFEMLAEYILVGFKVAIIVCAMLVGFIALMALLNGIFKGILGITFQDLLGYVFYPVAWILNIPSADLLVSGQVMGTKIVTNEFVAMMQLKDHMSELDPHTVGVLTVFLISFANFSSIGIIIGAVQAVSKKASMTVAKFSLKILYGATLVSILSSVVVGVFI